MLAILEDVVPPGYAVHAFMVLMVDLVPLIANKSPLTIGITFRSLPVLERKCPLPRDYSTAIASFATFAYSHRDKLASNQETYERHKDKGRRLIDWLARCLSTKGHSLWTNYSNLAQHGWSVRRRPVDYNFSGVGYWTTSMQQLFDAYTLSRDPADNVEVVWAHDQNTVVDGRIYQPSMGSYTNLFNSKVIIATHNYSPDHNGTKQTPPVAGADVTPLKHWSDVVFLEWQHFCNFNPTRSRSMIGIVQDDISNHETETTVAVALQAKTETGAQINKLGSFDDGIWFDISEPGAVAMLGTPLGQGIVYFLAQHTAKLGHKAIARIKVYEPNAYNKYALFFELQDL
jgi:hypothetical protein